MNTDAWPATAIFAALHVRSLDSDTGSERTTFRVNSMRSLGNIRRWRSYLPEDCVDTMIKMGWDQTT